MKIKIDQNTIKSEDLVRMHWVEEMTLGEIGIHYGYAPTTAHTCILYQFRKRGLLNRSRRQALLLRAKNKPETFYKNKPRGESHWKWNNGKRHNGGYLMVTQHNHPKADRYGYVREHLLVWEREHNKSLPKGWVIHHINGIRTDNRPENLIATPRKQHEHNTLMKILQERIRELEEGLCASG